MSKHGAAAALVVMLPLLLALLFFVGAPDAPGLWLGLEPGVGAGPWSGAGDGPGAGGDGPGGVSLYAVRLYQVLPMPAGDPAAGPPGYGEMMALVNSGVWAEDVSGWQVGREGAQVVLPPGTYLAPQQVLYLAHGGRYFRDYWGFAPDFEYGPDDLPAVANLAGLTPVLRNDGDRVLLRNAKGNLVDVLAYGAAPPGDGWLGPPVQFVTVFPILPMGQTLVRARDDVTLAVLPDTDRAADWTNGAAPNHGRLFYPGQSWLPATRVTEPAVVTALAAPDNSGAYLRKLIDGARRSLVMASYSFDSDLLADHLVAALQRGVQVMLFLERNTCCNDDISDQERSVHRRIEQAGGQVWYWHDWDGARTARVNYLHAKILLIDGESSLVGSENFGAGGYNADPTSGNRGWMVHVRGAAVTQLMTEVVAADLDPARRDVRRWDPKLDSPAPGFLPNRTVYQGAYRPLKAAQDFAGTFTFERILTPEHGLSTEHGIIGAIRSAREEILQQHQTFYRWWGDRGRDSEATYPNPYLEELIAAAARGVRVRMLLDRRFVDFDNQRHNHATVAYVNSLAERYGWDIEARIANLDAAQWGNYLHNKGLVIDGERVILSSINGTENSVKYNREAALSICCDSGLAGYYRDLFLYDWQAAAQPNRPWNLQAAAENGGTRLRWDPNVEPDVTHYTIWWRPGAEGTFEQVGTSTEPSFWHNETNGYWAVTATNSRTRASNSSELVVR